MDSAEVSTTSARPPANSATAAARPAASPSATSDVIFSNIIVMWVGMLVVLWRVDPVYGTLAFTAVLSRIVQAQFDLFWVAAQVSIPFVIAGICLGVQARAAAREVDERVLAARA